MSSLRRDLCNLGSSAHWQTRHAHWRNTGPPASCCHGLLPSRIPSRRGSSTSKSSGFPAPAAEEYQPPGAGALAGQYAYKCQPGARCSVLHTHHQGARCCVLRYAYLFCCCPCHVPCLQEQQVMCVPASRQYSASRAPAIRPAMTRPAAPQWRRSSTATRRCWLVAAGTAD